MRAVIKLDDSMGLSCITLGLQQGEFCGEFDDEWRGVVMAVGIVQAICSVSGCGSPFTTTSQLSAGRKITTPSW